MIEIVEDRADEKLLKNIMRTYRAKKGGLTDAILVVLSALSEDKYATPRWVNSILDEAGIKRADSVVRYEINKKMKGVKVIKTTRGGKKYIYQVRSCVESIDIKDYVQYVVDIIRPPTKSRVVLASRLNDYGRERVGIVLDSLE